MNETNNQLEETGSGTGKFDIYIYISSFGKETTIVVLEISCSIFRYRRREMSRNSYSRFVRSLVGSRFRDSKNDLSLSLSANTRRT